MGFFNNLFKENEQWSEKELMALFSLLKTMGFMDGKLDEDELDVIYNFILNLPGSSVKNVHQFSALREKSAKVKVKLHFDVIIAMDKKKKEAVIRGLGLVAAADGEVDSEEMQFLLKFHQILSS